MNKRIIGIDLIRLLLIGPIVMLHVWNILVGEPHALNTETKSLYPLYEIYIGNALGYSGIFVFCLTFFLNGIKRATLLKPKLQNLFKVVLLVGAMISSQFSGTLDFSDPQFFIWDIFSFVLLAYVVMSFLSKIENKKALTSLVVISLILFLIPVENYAFSLRWMFSQHIAPIFVSTTTAFGPNGWFLLPWIGLPIGYYSLGRLLLRIPKYLAPALICIGVIVLLVSDGRPMALGTQFYEYSFWQPPLFILSRLFIFTGILLGASQIKWPHFLNFLSYLQWNKNFWLCYILHIGLIDYLSDHKEVIVSSPIILNWLWVYVIAAIEVIVQIFFFAMNLYGKILVFIGKRLFKKLTTHPS